MKKKKADIVGKVMKQIKEKKVAMRPQWWFLLGSVLLSAGFTTLLLITVVISHLLVLRLRTHEPFGFLTLGRFGTRAFMATFPWEYLFLGLAGVLIGTGLVRKFNSAYKRGLLNWFVIITSGVVVTVLLLQFSGIVSNFMQRQPFRRMYLNNVVGNNFVFGEVILVSDSVYTLLTPEGEDVDVVLDKSTILPKGADISEGDQITVVGEWKDGIFYVKGMRPSKGMMEMMRNHHFPQKRLLERNEKNR